MTEEKRMTEEKKNDAIEIEIRNFFRQQGHNNIQ